MKIKDAAYIAGFIDADGAIMLHTAATKNPNQKKAQYSFIPKIEITNKNNAVMEWIVSVTKFNNNIIRFNVPNKKHRQKNPYYRMGFTGANIRKLLPEIIPHLKIKQKQGVYLLKIFKLINKVKVTGSNFRLRSEIHKQNEDQYISIWFKIACLNNEFGRATEMLYRKFRKKPEELLERL